MKNLIVLTNDFVKRQTPESHWSHFDGTWERLEALVIENFKRRRRGYRAGVVLVPVPPEGFWTPIVKIRETDEYETTCEIRRDGEKPALSTHATNRTKEPAASVDIVLYREDVLAEDPLNGIDPKDVSPSDNIWEIISINASPLPEGEKIPMKPYAMVRNELGLPGGTDATYSKHEYINAIRFWSEHTMASGE